MICYTCGETGHFVDNCAKLKTILLCNVPGDHMDVCPQWKKSHPMASYIGSASLGLGVLSYRYSRECTYLVAESSKLWCG